MPRLSPYDALNAWLFPRLGTYDQWSEGDFNNVIDRLLRLPKPTTPDEVATLVRSSLCISIGNLANRIRRGAGLRAGDVPETLGSAQRVVLLSRASIAVQLGFNARTWGALLGAATQTGAPADVLLDLTCAIPESVLAESPELLVYRVQASSAGPDGLSAPEMAAILAAARIDADGWGRLGHRAFDAGPQAFETLWRAVSPRSGDFSLASWASFAASAGRLGRGELLTEMWRLLERRMSAPERLQLDEATAVAFVRGCLALQLGKVAREVWSASVSSGVAHVSDCWSHAAQAAAAADDAELLRNVWSYLRGLTTPLDASALGFLADAAGRLRQHEALRGGWDRAAGRAAELSARSWGAFLQAAIVVHDRKLLEEIWNAAESSATTLDAPTLSSFAHAAGELGDGAIFDRVWRRSRHLCKHFDPHCWSSFFEAAGAIGSAGAAWELWALSLPARKTFQHTTWGALINAVGLVDDAVLLRDVFRALVGGFIDPLVHKHWGTLYRPLVRVAKACADGEVQREILETIRSQRVDLPRCMAVLRVVPPQPFDSLSGIFEGACLALSRYLVNSRHLKSAEEFDCDLRQIVHAILSLPPRQQAAVWPRLLGRGQEAHAAAVRAAFVENFAAVVGIGGRPWLYLNGGDRRAVIATLRDDGPNGLIQRITRFIDSMMASEAMPVRGTSPPGAAVGLVEYLVQNHLDYLNGIIDSEKATNHFPRVEEELACVMREDPTAEVWCQVLRAVMDRFAAVARQRLRVPLYEITHDIQKVACGEFILQAVRDEGTSTEIVGQLAGSVVDVLQCLDLAVLRVGAAPQDQAALNIGSTLRQQLSDPRLQLARHDVAIPSSVRMLAWFGARNAELVPLCSSIRINAATALAALDVSTRMYQCLVEVTTDIIRVTVSNSFDPTAAGRLWSNHVGRPSIQRRALLLNGRATFSEDLAGPTPVFRVTVELKAAPPELEETDGE